MRIKEGCLGFALVVISGLAALGCAELILRVVYPQSLGVWYTLRDGLVIHPPSLSIHLSQFGQTVQFNSFGMRDGEHSLNKKAGTYRILLFGDSFLEALQVPFYQSLPHMLQDDLAESNHQPVEVINCAVSGWGTDDQLEYLEQYGLKLQPDLILVGMTIHNDVSDNLEEQFHTFAQGKLLAKPKYEMPWLQYRSLKIKDFLASHFHLWQLLRKFMYRKLVVKTTERLDTHLSQLIRRDESIQLKRGWDMTFQLFNRIQESGHSVGAETVIFLIPLSIQLYGERFAKFLANHGVARDEIDLERPQAKMAHFGHASGIEVIDLLADFRGWIEKYQEPLHVADGHWNATGHRIAAAVVSKELVRRGIIKSQQK